MIYLKSGLRLKITQLPNYSITQFSGIKMPICFQDFGREKPDWQLLNTILHLKKLTPNVGFAAFYPSLQAIY
jgi:hypothetical protein